MIVQSVVLLVADKFGNVRTTNPLLTSYRIKAVGDVVHPVKVPVKNEGAIAVVVLLVVTFVVQLSNELSFDRTVEPVAIAPVVQFENVFAEIVPEP